MLKQNEWDVVYVNRPIEAMPWYHPELDPDLSEALHQYGFTSGRFLDIGAGCGNQAAALSDKGFDVTGVDISHTAIENASKAFPSVTFLQDDITQSKLPNLIQAPFDIVFDRGCFHTLPNEHWPHVASTIASLVKPKGWFFLKCFRDIEPMTDGPYRFTIAELDALFLNHFNRVALKETIYQSQLTPHPLANFISFQRK